MSDLERPPLPPNSLIAVIGAGAMGAGIAQIVAQSGHRVLLFDTRLNGAEDAQKKLATTFEQLAAKGKMTSDDAQAAAGRIVPIHALGDCVSARLVIEAIVEDLEAKRELWRDLEGVVAPETILATNTSSLSVTAMAAGLKYPRRVAGLHFFNPPPLMPLVEIVSGLATDPEVAATLYSTAAGWGKVPVHAKSTPGFIVNRCARPFYAEALRLLNERAADPATIDAVMREAGGFRMGPFELLDLIGNDVSVAVTTSVWRAYSNDPRFTPSAIQQEMVAAGYLGRKSGRGFYDYAPGTKKPIAHTEPEQPAPGRVVVYGDLGPASTLVERMLAAGVPVERAKREGAFPTGVIGVGGAWLALSDGQTATVRAGASGAHDMVLFDLALDFATCTRLAVARADTCSDAAYSAAVGALQAAGIAVSRLDDAAGLVVLRTVAMLANECADAAKEAIASPRDIDAAMMKGVNYPRGPLAWADAIGVARVRDALANLAAHYGEDRYRISPLITRRAVSGARLID